MENTQKADKIEHDLITKVNQKCPKEEYVTVAGGCITSHITHSVH